MDEIRADLYSDDLAHVWHPFQQATTYRQRQLIAVNGEGPYVIDHQGRRYLDAISGLWNLNLGYSEQRVIKAITQQLEAMPFTSLIVFSHEPSIRLAKALAERSPGDLNTVFFTSGGSEGIETALKLSRHIAYLQGEPLRHNILALRGAYHGMSYGALSVTGVPDDRWQFGALLPGVHHIRSPQGLPNSENSTNQCIADLIRTLEFLNPKTVCALIIEPVMGAGGMVPPPPGYLSKIQEICNRNGIILIFDEVTAGMGRTGCLFAADLYEVLPDIIVLAKGLSAGYYPLGAVLVKQEFFELCEKNSDNVFMHGFTYGGSPAACAAGLAYLEVVESDKLLNKVRADGRYLLHQMQQALAKYNFIKDIRGVGLMIAVALEDPKHPNQPLPRSIGNKVQQVARENGLIIRSTYGGSTFNFAPPFICTQDELDKIAQIFSHALGEVV
ncbi:aspartate aminotransferase family protein [Oculatella sp. LEGE 06141]|uniref:aminotransferase family protein n=1 Tax=Oculatella sp. LEGE 06141 TaxID=1828648 RepID=UPI001881933C|nr:aspartate aminotransferase family protein [Oculatella sp. LEGE 06141]MBE9179340.1 aspartate aminotransferase family protein [Oculatella sp. LEGE 06141]